MRTLAWVGLPLAVWPGPVASAQPSSLMDRASEPIENPDCRVPKIAYGTFAIYATELTWKGSQLTAVFEVKNIDPKVAKSTRTGRRGSRDTASGTLWPELLKRTTRYAPNASSLSAGGPLSSNGGPMQPALASARSRLLFDDVPQADYTFRLTRVRSDAIKYSPEVWTCAIPAFPGAKDVGDDFNRSLGWINEVVRNLQNSTADKKAK